MHCSFCSVGLHRSQKSDSVYRSTFYHSRRFASQQDVKLVVDVLNKEHEAAVGYQLIFVCWHWRANEQRD